MRSRNQKTRNAWLITWESSREDYLADLKRPRVVGVLKPNYGSAMIKCILPVLFTSESRLRFSEKIGYSFGRRHGGWLKEDDNGIWCGDNPRLRGRLVKDLYVQTYEETVWRQTLHWTEYPRYAEDPNTFQLVVVHPERKYSEDVQFDVLWYGRSFLEDDERAG